MTDFVYTIYFCGSGDLKKGYDVGFSKVSTIFRKHGLEIKKRIPIGPQSNIYGEFVMLNGGAFKANITIYCATPSICRGHEENNIENLGNLLQKSIKEKKKEIQKGKRLLSKRLSDLMTEGLKSKKSA